MNKSPICYLLICLFAYLFICLLVTPSANAQSVDLGIYPPVFQIQTSPPSNVKVPFFIQNFADSSIDLIISLTPFTASPSQDGTVTFLDNLDSLPDPSLLQKIQVLDDNGPIQTLTLAPKQKKDLTLTINLPSSQTKGDYYISIVFNSANQTTLNSNFTQNLAGITSNILLSIGPVGPTKGYVENFSAPAFIAKGPVPFTIGIKNDSDHFITPKGDIVVTNMFGQNVGKVNLLPVNILSNTIRRIPDAIQKDETSKDYALVKSVADNSQFPVAVWPEKLLLGPYTATLTLTLSDSGPLFKKSIFFFAFPTEYLVIILAIILIVFFTVLRVRKKLA